LVEDADRDGVGESFGRVVVGVVLTLSRKLPPHALPWRALLQRLRPVRFFFAFEQLAQQGLELIHHGGRNQTADDTRRQSLQDIALVVVASASALALLFSSRAHHIVLILMYRLMSGMLTITAAAIATNAAPPTIDQMLILMPVGLLSLLSRA
jgi:hypothetical protein